MAGVRACGYHRTLRRGYGAVQSPSPLRLALAFALVAFGAAAAGAQTDTFQLRRGDSLLLDVLGQVYRWRADQSLQRYRAANTLAGRDTLRQRYVNVGLGRIQSVDLSNPLQPLLFYGDAQRAVWLDRNLVELRGLNLLDLDVGTVDAVAYASNEGLWLYAPDRQRLVQLDRQGRIVHESPDLAQAFGKPVRARALAATPQQVALATTDGRILLFDAFGTYRTQLLRAGAYLSATERQLLFHDAEGWWSYRGGGALLEPVRVSRADGARLLAARGPRALWVRGGRAWLDGIE